MKLEITLPFNQKVEISTEKVKFSSPENYFISNIKMFAEQAINVLQEKELNWAAKLVNMTNEKFAIDRCGLIQKDLNKLGKLSCECIISKIN